MSDDIRKRILDSSEIILKKEGFERFNIRRIAKLSDISVGSVYLYFSNKSDLVVALLDKLLQELQNRCNTKIINCKSLMSSLEMIYFEYSSFLNDFQVNLMSKLTGLIDSPKGNIKTTHLNFFSKLLKDLLFKYKDNIDQDLIKNLGYEAIIDTIMAIFNQNLQINNNEYCKVSYLLQKILF